MSFVDAHDFSVDLVLRVLGIPASTYYDWRARRTAPSLRRREDEELLRLIDAIRGEHEFAATYGSPRVWLELRRRGVRVGRKRVERIMRVHGRQGAYLRRGWKHGSTRQNPRHTAAPDLLGRDFTATAPNTKWVADLTRILTVEGVLWLASVRDAFSNKVVGWDSGPRATTELVVSALDYAIWSRDVRDGQLVHHSDKGCQGGFNWSSQHLDFSEVCDGVREATVGGSWLSGSDSLAGTADGGLAAGPGPVLGGHCCGGDDRGRRGRSGRVVAGRVPLVPPCWRRESTTARVRFGSLFVFG